MSDFVPANSLEAALVRAAQDPVARPDFYRELLKAQLFIIDERPGPHGEGERT